MVNTIFPPSIIPKYDMIPVPKDAYTNCLLNAEEISPVKVYFKVKITYFPSNSSLILVILYKN